MALRAWSGGRQTPGQVVALKDVGTGGDKQAGDGTFTVTLAAADVLKNFTPDDVQRNFIGDLTLQGPGQTAGPYHLFADVLTPNVPTVSVTKVSNEAQYNERLVNIVDADFFALFSADNDTAAVKHAVKKFYGLFDDSYDFLNVIAEFAHFGNRHHAATRNFVQGVGIAPLDQTASFGSAGRLLGYTVFPIPTMFDGAGPVHQHELGHQWINFLNVAPLAAGIPHYPLSDLAACLMGWSKAGGQGLSFDFALQPAGNDFTLVADSSPKTYCDLSQYLMGLLPANQVKDHFVFKNQDQALAPGPVPASALTKVTIGAIVQAMGARVPAAGQAQKKFRVATIVVSKDGLLSTNTLRLYDYFAARAEATTLLPYSDGAAKGQTRPFSLATEGRGRLDMRIKRRILVDASGDGGVWWFPQAAGFDATAPHQGLALAQHLRSLGHTVNELPRPTAITAALLTGRDVVIRAAGRGGYTATEITAYHDFVNAGGGLLLLAEFGPPDALATSFGLKFEGRTRGDNLLSAFTPHPITKGVGPLAYQVGGGLTTVPATAQVVGKLSAQSFLDLNGNGVKDSGEPASPGVLGVMTVGAGRIVFCGDTNLWEGVPQPLTKNVLAWLTGP